MLCSIILVFVNVCIKCCFTSDDADDGDGDDDDMTMLLPASYCTVCVQYRSKV